MRGGLRGAAALVLLAVLPLVAGCVGGDDSEPRPELSLRLPSSAETCELITDTDFPGDEFRFVAGSADTFEDGSFQSDASCAWIGEFSNTLGILVVDYGDDPDGLAVEIARLQGIGLPADDPLNDLDGFDPIARDGLAVSAVAGSLQVTVSDLLVTVDTSERDRLVETLLMRWLALAQS